VVDVSTDANMRTQKSSLSSNPDIIVGTPARVNAHLLAKNISLGRIKTLVLDEADLILSYGYEVFILPPLRVLFFIISHLPR
jgi:ATP-dependent RNA helicase DDX56/DBP9